MNQQSISGIVRAALGVGGGKWGLLRLMEGESSMQILETSTEGCQKIHMTSICQGLVKTGLGYYQIPKPHQKPKYHNLSITNPKFLA